MLISRDVFMNKLGMNRHDISLKELQDIQTQYGISIDSLMYKAKSLNIITPNRYKTYFINKKNKPLFKENVEESRYKREESSRFERLVFRALASDIISISKASTLLNLPITEVRNQLNLV
jgi:Zn-dependent peptidase ImmA (M78 family)